MFNCKKSPLQGSYCFNSQKCYLDLFQSMSWKQPTAHVHKELQHFWHHQINRRNWTVITIIVNLPEVLCWGPLPFCWGCFCAESVLKGLGSPILPITSLAGLSTVNSITISTFLWRKKNNMRITKYLESQRLAVYWVTSFSWVSSWFKGNRGQIEMRLSSQTMAYFVLISIS